MSGLQLGLTIAVCVVVGVGAILGTVFTLVFRAIRKREAVLRAELEHEGIVKESARVSGSVRYRDYKAPGFYASRSLSTTSRRLVLTRATFAMIGGGRNYRVPRGELHRYAVTTNEDGRLVIVTDSPVGASGHMDMRLKMPDAESWVRALREAGATGG
jgi:hypothetical protein